MLPLAEGPDSDPTPSARSGMPGLRRPIKTAAMRPRCPQLGRSLSFFLEATLLRFIFGKPFKGPPYFGQKEEGTGLSNAGDVSLSPPEGPPGK